MKKSEIIKKTRGPIEDILESKSLELVDIELAKDYGSIVFRVLADKKGGLTMEDCQVASEAISEWLDREDPIPGQYLLEVSSPGLDRPLKTDRDLERAEGEELEIKMYAPVEGKKKFVGTILGFDQGSITLRMEADTVVLNREDIAKINRVIKIGGK
ncbi:MAG: ribosome maturation factor RimP [Tissierellia bacterium]|nr:ribosome maturation factor RimP [Tissierellia bacterium]